MRYVEDKFNTGHLTTLQVGKLTKLYHVQSSIGVRLGDGGQGEVE